MKVGQTQDISQIDPTSRSGVRTTNDSGASSAAPAAAGSSGQIDSVSISSASMALGGSAAVNTDKVAAIRQAVSNGTYQIDPAAIADRMIAEAASLLQTLSEGGRQG